MAIKELNEEQLRAVELLASGESQAATSRLVNVNPKTIQRWLKDDVFKSEVERQAQEIKNNGNKKLANNINAVMDKMIYIALNGKSEKNSLDACIQILNRVYGMPTSKIENVNANIDVNSSTQNKADINELLSEVDANVIELKTKAL